MNVISDLDCPGRSHSGNARTRITGEQYGPDRLILGGDVCGDVGTERLRQVYAVIKRYVRKSKTDLFKCESA